MIINKISNFHETQMSGIMEVLKPTKEVFGLNGKEEMLANKEAESEADKAIRISEEKADWDSSFGYDEWRDNQD